MKVKKQAGMTLIELVIVIIVLAIISAIAVPRFVDLQSTAATQAQNATEGAMMSAYVIAVGEQLGTPTWTQYIAKISDMTCGAADGICTSGDFDGDAGANDDVQYQFYVGTGCDIGVDEVSAGTDVPTTYRVNATRNAAPVVGDTCVPLF